MNHEITISYEIWIAIIAILTTSSIHIIALGFTIRHFNKTHTTNSEQFHAQITQTNNVETVKQLSYFDEKFIKLTNEFNNSNKEFSNCMMFSKQWILFLDQLCYLYDKKRIDKDFLEYFTARIDMGKRFANWIQLMENANNISYSYVYFLKYYSDFNIKLDVEIQTSFIFFLYKYKDLPEFNTVNDHERCDDWLPPKNYRNSEYYELLHRDPLMLIKSVLENPSSIFKFIKSNP